MRSFLRLVSLFVLALLVTFNSALPALAQGGSIKEATKDQEGPKNPNLPGGLPPNLTFSTLHELTDTSLSYTVVNNGLGATGKGFDVMYTWLNQDKKPLKSMTEVIMDTSLDAGKSIFVDLPQFSFQPSAEAAFLEIAVDSAETISESVETDNTILLSLPQGLGTYVPVNAQYKPDLLISNAVWKGTNFTIFVKNIGPAPVTTQTVVRLQWIKNNAIIPISEDPEAFFQVPMPSLSSNQEYGLNSSWINQFVANTPDPNADLQIIIDPKNLIDELDEFNNTKEPSLNADASGELLNPPALPDELPDISVAGFVMTAEAVTIVVENTGAAPTNQEVLLVLQWMKNNEAIGGGALEILLGIIGVGEKMTKTFAVGDGSSAGQFFATPPAAGAFLQALVDPDNGIVEEDDLDNSATAIPITLETSGKDLKALDAKGDKLLPDYDPTILPGDALYPAKGVFEKVESFFAFTEQKKVGVAVKHAAKKAKEIHTLIEKIEDETNPAKHEKLLDALEKAVEAYEKKMHTVSEKLSALHPEEKQEHAEAAKNAFTHAIDGQELVDAALDTLPAHASIAVASAHDASFTAAAEALHAINEPSAQHAAIEEILHENGNPLDAVEHVAILNDLADHVADVVAAASDEAIHEQAENAETIENETENTEEETAEENVVEEDAFEQEDVVIEEDDFIVEEVFDNESLDAVLAGFQEAEVAEAAINLGILSESYGPLATDYMAEIADETPGEVLVALDEIEQETESQWSDEALSEALSNMADAFNTKMEELEETDGGEQDEEEEETGNQWSDEALSDALGNAAEAIKNKTEKDAAGNETEKFSEEELEQALKNMGDALNKKKKKTSDLPPFLSLPKNDPVKSLRILEKLGGKVTNPTLSKKIDAAFDHEAITLVGGLLQNNGKSLGVLAEHVANTKGSDLTQLVILEKIGSRIAAAPLTGEHRAVAERTLGELRGTTTETVQRKIDAAPDEESRRRALFSILGTANADTESAQRAQARLNIRQNDLDAINQKREEARRRQTAIEAEFQLKQEERRRREAGVLVPVQERGAEKQIETRQQQQVPVTEEKRSVTKPTEDVLPAVEKNTTRTTSIKEEVGEPIKNEPRAVQPKEEQKTQRETEKIQPDRIAPVPTLPTTRIATSTRPTTVAPTRVVPIRVPATPTRTKTESKAVSPTRKTTETKTDTSADRAPSEPARTEEAARTTEPAPTTGTEETTETRTVEPVQPAPIAPAPRAVESTGSTRTQSVSTDASSTWGGFLDRLPLVRNFLRFTAFAGMDFLLK